MPRYAHILLLLSVLLVAALVQDVVAQEALTLPPAPAKLSLREAVRLSLENSPQLKDAYVSYLAAKSDLATAGDLSSTDVFAGLLQESVGGVSGQLSANLGSRFSWLRRSGDELSATVVPATTSDFSSDLQVQYRRPLIRQSGRTSNTNVRLAFSEYAMAQQEHQIYLARQNLAEQTIRAYFSAVRARDIIVVDETSVDIAKETVRSTTRRVEEGLDAEIEQARAENNLARSENSLVESRRAYRDALDRLLLTMGLEVGQSFELTDTAAIEPTELNADALVKEALENRKDLLVTDLAVERQKLSLDIASDNLRPALDALARYTQAGIGGSGFSSQTFWSAGLEYSLPIGDTGRKENRLVAERELQQLYVNRRFERQQITDEVLASVREVEAAAASLDIFKNNLKVVEDNLRIAQRMVEEGLASNREVLDAQAALTSTRSGMLNAEINYYLALVSLQRAVGRDIAEEMAA